MGHSKVTSRTKPSFVADNWPAKSYHAFVISSSLSRWFARLLLATWTKEDKREAQLLS